MNFNYFDDDIAVHSIAPRVYYNTKSDVLTTVAAEQSKANYHKNADLIEVVFIELKKREQIRNAENLKKLLDVICNNEKETETLKALLNLTDEEVCTMLKQVSFREEILEEGKETAKAKCYYTKTPIINGKSIGTIGNIEIINKVKDTIKVLENNGAKVDYVDIKYIDKITFWGDIKILFKTVYKVFKHDDIVREGTQSDMDFGDWLLAENKITQDEYDTKANEAMEIIGQCKK